MSNVDPSKKDPKISSESPDTLTKPSSNDGKIELNEEELSRVSGGACVAGKHIPKVSL